MLPYQGYGSKLVITKFDQLSRNSHFPLDFEKAGIEFAISNLHANWLTVGMIALVQGGEWSALEVAGSQHRSEL